jgi:DedD protein
MRIFSFGKKDDASNRRGANTSSKRGSNGVDRSGRVERRSRRAERAGDADAMLLDPTLPEKQRARRRLVGAIALVVAAVVILPMVLDSHPKPVTDDISIDIPSRPVSRARVQDPQDTQAGVAPDNPAAPEGASGADEGIASPSTTAPAAAAALGSPNRDAVPQGNAPAQQAQAQSAGKSQRGGVTAANTPTAAAKQTAKPAPTAGTNTAAAAKSSPSPAQSTETATNTAQGATAAQADSSTPAAPSGSRFAVQLGSFSDDASARNWVNKLKAAGVPAYIEKRKQADGSVHTLLRAGPFADRAAASAAIAKVREAGLTSGANNGSAQ